MGHARQQLKTNFYANFLSVCNEIRSVLVTRVLNNNLTNINKKRLPISPKILTKNREGRATTQTDARLVSK